uniref:Uncharacterized protein n=1 Tax=Arundo donax TaxID=35708 RepID=A0A0A9GYU4_ARUDO
MTYHKLDAEFMCTEEEKEIITNINASEQSKVVAVINGSALTKKEMEKLTLPLEQGSIFD